MSPTIWHYILEHMRKTPAPRSNTMRLCAANRQCNDILGYTTMLQHLLQIGDGCAVHMAAIANSIAIHTIQEN